MTQPADTSYLLSRHRQGATGATDALIDHTCDRLRLLTRRMLRQYPVVHRWEQTDDVLQNALLRLYRALSHMPVESPRHYYNLAALQIRRELLDLADRHQGPEGLGRNLETDQTLQVAAGPPSAPDEPSSLAEWAEFHRHVGRLPDEQREVFDLLWYQGLDQGAAAELLGVSVRTLKRRWQATRLALARVCIGPPPM